MSGRTILVVALALACGLAAFVGISMMGRGGPGVAVPTKPVVYAIAEIRRGEPIQKEMIEVRKVAEASVPPAALGKPEDVLDRIAGMKMLPGDAVTDAKLEVKGARSRLVPAGKLAFTVARADMPPLEVDDHVDVYFTTSGQAVAPDPLQDILVWEVAMADGKSGATNAQGPVTLLVEPPQANSLNHGMNQGTLRLVRRNPNDPARLAILPPPPTPPAPLPTMDLAAGIEPGMRAFTIEAPNPLATLGGRLRRGDHVDVILTRKATAGTSDATTTTLPNVEVLGMPEGAGPAGKDGRSVTLLVPPEDAATLAQAQAQAEGTILLSLRKPGDVAVPPPPAPVAPDQEVTMTTKTLRGTYIGSDRLIVRIPAPRARGVGTAITADSRPGPSLLSGRGGPARGR